MHRLAEYNAQIIRSCKREKNYYVQYIVFRMGMTLHKVELTVNDAHNMSLALNRKNFPGIRKVIPNRVVRKEPSIERGNFAIGNSKVIKSHEISCETANCYDETSFDIGVCQQGQRDEPVTFQRLETRLTLGRVRACNRHLSSSTRRGFKFMILFSGDSYASDMATRRGKEIR
jgi:hypothetical protein